jgi:hypothetical protein
MKKVLIILFGVLFLLQSCKKEATTKQPVRKTITQELKANEVYEFNLGAFGDEDGVAISKQATNFLISVINRNAVTEQHIYKYQPATNFIGTDEVEFKATQGSDGASAGNTITYTTIKFTIRN